MVSPCPFLRRLAPRQPSKAPSYVAEPSVSSRPGRPRRPPGPTGRKRLDESPLPRRDGNRRRPSRGARPPANGMLYRRRIGTVEWQQALRALVDEYRNRCLWFLDRDYYPVTPDEARMVLAHIEHSGDLSAFQRARRIREWLSLTSNARSAAS